MNWMDVQNMNSWINLFNLSFQYPLATEDLFMKSMVETQMNAGMASGATYR